MASPRPNSFHSQSFLPNGNNAPGHASPNPSAGNSRVIQAGSVRVLCVADVRGNLRSLNELAKQARADHIIHTGDFGFYDESSLERIAEKTLKHVAQYSPLISDKIKKEIQQVGPQQPPIKQRYSAHQLPLSELSSFINKTYRLDVPVYTVWGACEDVRVLEKFRSGEYRVDKLHIIDEANSRLLDVGGVKLRLFGLGGAVVMHKLFDNGEGRTTIAGGQGTMWTTLLQMGELVDTANRVYDPTETRVFVTHASPAREGLLNQLSVTLKADFSISAGLHFRYGSSYNEFSVNPTLDHYRGKLAASKASFNDVWETVKGEVEPAVGQNEGQQTLLNNALDIVHKMPTVANGGNPFGGPVGGTNAGGQVDESAFKNMWNFNLADAAFGYLVLEIEGGRIGTEMRAQGFNFSHRGGKHSAAQSQALAPNTNSGVPNATPMPAAMNQIHTHVPSGPPANQHYGQQQRNAPDRSQQQQQQHPKPPTGPAVSTQPAGPARSNQPSPAAPNNQPSASNNQSSAPNNQSSAPSNQNQPKPASGQQQPDANAKAPSPAAERNGTPSQPEPVKNANGASDSKPSGTSEPNKTQSPTERKPTHALFVTFVKDEEACRAMFPEEDRAKIVRIERTKGGAHVVYFNSSDDVRAALDHQPAENKKRGEQGHPNMKIYVDRHPQYYGQGHDGGAGRWQGSNRGPSNSGGQGGYRSGGGASGGAASDSEGGRGGRGGFRNGPRGRNDRSRGGRTGRGSYNNNSGNSKPADGGEARSPAAASATPNAPASTPQTGGGES